MLSVAAAFRPRRARRRPRGFTLVEILVALTLLGILTTLALPSFTGWIRNTQVRTAAEVLQNGLRVAQTEALRRSMQVVFYRTNSAITSANIGNGSTTPPNFPFAAAGVNWVVLTTPTFGATAADVQYVQGGSLGNAGSATNLTGTVSSVCFDANGRIAANAPSTLPTGVTCTAPVAGQPFTFIASQSAPADRELWVQVTSGGRVRMCDPKRTLSATAPDGC